MAESETATIERVENEVTKEDQLAEVKDEYSESSEDELFGYVSGNSGSGGGSPRPTGLGGSDEDNEEQQIYNRKFYGDNKEVSDQSRDEEVGLKEADVEIVKHDVPYYTTSNTTARVYYAKIPHFLTIDPVPFDPPMFEAQIKYRLAKYSSKEEQLDDRLIDENTIRWRYSRGNNQHVFKESNARIIQWSDGTYSLKLGDEYSDILINDVENTYITVSHEQQELMQCFNGGKLTKSMIFIPTSTNSKIHQRLSNAVARREAREHSGLSTYIVRTDPELEKKELEKKHDQIIRKRRKRQLKEQMDRENAEFDGLETGSFNPKRTAAKKSATYSYTRQLEDEENDEYDDEDDFIDDEELDAPDHQYDHASDSSSVSDSENEDNINAERLKNLKREGATIYKLSNSPSEHIDPGEDKLLQKHRKVAVINSDDE